MLRQLLIFSVLTVIFINPALAAGDAKIGAEKAALCMGCHGDKGISVSPAYPNLAAQHASYIEKQLTELKSGARKDPTMSPMAATLQEPDMADIAAFFSNLAPAPAEGVGKSKPALLARGKQLYMGGDRYKEIPACAACHSPTGAGNPQARFPRLAGQHDEYVVAQLKKFKNGERANDPNKMMRDITARMSMADINAIAAYIATLE
ncbi:MAG: c-type cytochrome [Pseudomonadota bacterium]